MTPVVQLRTPEPIASPEATKPCIVADHLSAFFGDTPAVKDVSISIPQNAVTAIIGPSGCGKSTLLRCFNRMHETVPGARVEGSVEILGSSIYGDGSSPIAVRLACVSMQRVTRRAERPARSSKKRSSARDSGPR
jgi:phosphate transport system ATP-binding protein